VIGFIQGKSVIRPPCACGDTEEVLLARASGRVFRLDVGRAEEIIRTYIRNQEQLANVGAVEPLALTGHFSGRLTWGRVSDPIGRFERPTSKAPGFAGGYLLGVPEALRELISLGRYQAHYSTGYVTIWLSPRHLI
jgi:hypothetical protein